MRVFFMGTPDFAVPCLEAVVRGGHEVVGVFTREDKPVGRKQILTPPPVKVCAESHGIPVFQPKKLRDGTAAEIIRGLKPDVIVVVAYGRILPDDILSIPKIGCINVHASLLPRHRGASPIQWSIVSGDKYTGVTTMLMDSGLDTGDILLTEKTEIGANETGGELFDRLSLMGAELLIKTLDNFDNITPVKQSEDGVTFAPIITKEMAKIDFNDKTAEEICCAVRGFNPWPVAYFMLDGKRIKVYEAHSENIRNVKAGTVICSENDFGVACKSGAVFFDKLKPEGSREMTAAEYLRGNPVNKGTVICD